MFGYLKEYFKDWNLWDWSWVLIASATAIWLGLQWADAPGWRTWLSIITVLTGLWCVILVAKGRIFNYYLGIINVIGYAYICWGYALWGEVMLNAGYFLPMQGVGLWIWLKNKDPKVPDKVKVKFMTSDQRVHWFLISLAATAVYGLILRYMGDPVPFLDSTSTILSIIAMILMAWRYMEQWVLWIVVDIVSIWMWVLVLMEQGTNDTAVIVMWSAYLINAFYGFYLWIKMYKEQS